MGILPPSMTPREYKKWLKDPRSRAASEKDFFPSGAERTLNVLEGDAIDRSVAKRRSFGARHYAQFKENPTFKRGVALRNWGYDVNVPKRKR